ncbi:hypothetical protein GLOIN_2v1879550 [Rhizophagus irregularis DAOM 181602=DAOM 197198]|uniref:Zn-finger domain-containing protein n=1 Tax=Rhizophagus irregularis (strain DAOM 181602 / DAOM 197198 / MUCL 43194) TaxID=747089 RepID=A0A2P4PN49_RHIID|nr:hypothetical protein GLOIN_2v1879550 [Rhizophagus irregularis DAOM 181602=DAOM 197198]POG66797.1 hypothetical protein GLOIN_2v1879550 [Rhizophagus irregularis DAOM 181602=DAOM 197198]|eukprot:XP_025173663.1 hypothetical protein GLOIN_2v1879550 [Rhizophagus irregularis DAOM 181602=DAOM 197198]
MPLCMRIFSQHFAYTQHAQKCLKNVKVDDDDDDSEKYNSEMDTRSNQSSEYENDKVEVDDDNDAQNMSFDSIGSAISVMSLEDNFENILDSSEEPEIFEESENPNSKTYTEFSNDAYKDLMLLVMKYKINNKGGNEIIRFFNKHSNLTESPLPKNIEQGRAFMNNMKFSNLEFSKVLITKHKDKDYFLYYQNLIQCIKNILTVPDITQNFALSYENYEYNRESIYSEQNTGKWWKTTQESLPTGSKLLSIILYSDATTTDTLGKSQLHPIYISLGNIPIWRRNKQDAKQLLGYLPILEAANKDLVRDTFHKSLRHLLEPIILLKDGIDLFINNENTWFYPRVSTIIADWPEAASFCLVYKSSNSSLPCHSCLIKRDNLANINLSVNDVILRTHDEMRKYFENDTQKSVCIESVPNFFWDLPNINIYLATVPDRMHHLDLGLFRYQIIFTCDILKLQHVNGNKLVEEVDRRLAAIPRFPAIKIFSNGLQSIARLTANEYRSLMKVMIFVIDNLYDENNNEVDNFVNNDDLVKLYEYWNEMYILSRYEEFSESDLEKFNDAIHRWARMFVKAFKFVSPSNLKLPKLHLWIKRQAISIRMSQHSVNPVKTPLTCKFSARLFEFSLQDANTFFNEKKDSVDNKMQTGFARFICCLDSYLDLLNGFTIIGETRINIYRSVILENGAIMRATNRYHNKVWFSDIAI